MCGWEKAEANKEKLKVFVFLNLREINLRDEFSFLLFCGNN